MLVNILYELVYHGLIDGLEFFVFVVCELHYYLLVEEGDVHHGICLFALYEVLNETEDDESSVISTLTCERTNSFDGVLKFRNICCPCYCLSLHNIIDCLHYCFCLYFFTS